MHYSGAIASIVWMIKHVYPLDKPGACDLVVKVLSKMGKQASIGW